MDQRDGAGPEGAEGSAGLCVHASAVLGAVLTAVSMALRHLPTLSAPPLPRMADFARWACAAAPALGWSATAFLRAYERNLVAASDVVLEASLVARAVLLFMEHHRPWAGTATQLLTALAHSFDGLPATQRPQTTHRLSNALCRLVPNLAKAQLAVTFFKKPGGTRDRLIELRTLPGSPAPGPDGVGASAA